MWGMSLERGISSNASSAPRKYFVGEMIIAFLTHWSLREFLNKHITYQFS